MRNNFDYSRSQAPYWDLIAGRRQPQRFVSSEPIASIAGIGQIIGSNTQLETKENVMEDEKKELEKAKRQFPNSPELYGDPLPVDDDGEEISYDKSPELYAHKKPDSLEITEAQRAQYPKMSEELGLKTKAPVEEKTIKEESAATTVEESGTEEVEEEEASEEYEAETDLSVFTINNIASDVSELEESERDAAIEDALADEAVPEEARDGQAKRILDAIKGMS